MPEGTQSPYLIQVSYDRGIYLPEADLWLDPAQTKERAFVSHAHSDHVGRHGQIVCTRLTHDLMHLRSAAGRKTSFLLLESGESLCRDGFQLTVLPAGHILGSAMLHLTRLRDGATLLYTGDYKLRAGLTGEQAVLRQADTLIMETTFGLRRYQFPPVEQTAAAMVNFAEDSLKANSVPMLLGYSLGKAQEILAAMREITHPVMLHPTVEKVTRLLLPHLGAMPKTVPWNESEAHGHVLVLPPHTTQMESLKKRYPCRVAMVSGWALDSSAKYRYRTDEVFPLSDHADYPELLETVERVRPRRIYTVHGFTREFASDLRARGYDARALGRVEQLDLAL